MTESGAESNEITGLLGGHCLCPLTLDTLDSSDIIQLIGRAQSLG